MSAMQLSEEQRAIVEAAVGPLSIKACAGSGKTRTAVHRLLNLRELLRDSRGHITLLSFSNVAVDAFRSELNKQRNANVRVDSSRITVATVDSFFASNVIQTHGKRSMGASRTPFLVQGGEPFLLNDQFKYWAEPASGNAFPVTADSVLVNLVSGVFTFSHSVHGSSTVPINNGIKATDALGKTGAYAHETGRYWALRVLREQPIVLRALARRYPHIIIDEAQDIGSMHAALLDLLVTAGVQVSLVGDTAQAIFEFAGADGSYLNSFAAAGVQQLPLTRNYRSNDRILAVANRIASRVDSPDRFAEHGWQGVFFAPYSKLQEAALVNRFHAAVVSHDIRLDEAVVVCRSRDLLGRLAGTNAVFGKGAVVSAVQAATLRDIHKDISRAYKALCSTVFALLSGYSEQAPILLRKNSNIPAMRQVRLLLWRFLRDPDTGLPFSGLHAQNEWHPLLKDRLEVLLNACAELLQCSVKDDLGRKVTKTNLPNRRLDEVVLAPSTASLSHETVHQVKGRSLDAVLYLATDRNVKALVEGVGTVLGRIGYVSVTRARDLFVLGVPEQYLSTCQQSLLDLGFGEWQPNSQSEP